MAAGLRPVRQFRHVDDRRGDPGGDIARPDRHECGQDASGGADRAASGDHHRHFPVHDAGRAGNSRLHPRRGDRLFPDRLDRAQRHLHVPADGGDRRICDSSAGDRRGDVGPPTAIAADRLRLRRFLRRCLRLWHAGRGHRRGPDRPRLFAAGGIGPLADRQHRTCRLWCARHADRRPRQCYRARPLPARCDGRTAIAVLLADRTGLADLRVCRLAGDGSDLAGDPRLRGVLCDPPILDFQFHQSLDCRYRRLADLHGLPDFVLQGMAAGGVVDLSGVATTRRFRGDDAPSAPSRPRSRRPPKCGGH